MLTKPNHKKMMIIFDNNYKPLAENHGLMRRWTEYGNELYNYPIQINEELIIDKITSQHDISLPILKSEVRNAINTLTNIKLLVFIISPIS